MTLLAGLFAGVIMAMIFLPHLALVLVFSRQFTGWPRAEGDGPSPTAWLLMAFAAGSFLMWAALGVAAALLFTIAQRAAPTHVPGIPSVVYLAGVVFLVLLAVPWVAILAPRLWRHAAFESAVFVAIFGFQIPMTAGTG
jgi:hypothetical protein